MERLETLSQDRQSAIKDAKRLAMSDEIRPLVLRKVGSFTSQSPGQPSSVDAAQFEPLFEEELRKYDMYLRRLQDSKQEQEAILKDVTVSEGAP